MRRTVELETTQYLSINVEVTHVSSFKIIALSNLTFTAVIGDYIIYNFRIMLDDISRLALTVKKLNDPRFVPTIYRQKNYHELEFWEDVTSIEIYFDTADSWPALLTKLTGFFGRQPEMPKWLYNGAVLGLQGGKEKVSIGHDRS